MTKALRRPATTTMLAAAAHAINRKRRRATGAFPPPLWGRAREGGRCWSSGATDIAPPPDALRASTSPTRGEVSERPRPVSAPLPIAHASLRHLDAARGGAAETIRPVHVLH